MRNYDNRSPSLDLDQNIIPIYSITEDDTYTFTVGCMYWSGDVMHSSLRGMIYNFKYFDHHLSLLEFQSGYYGLDGTMAPPVGGPDPCPCRLCHEGGCFEMMGLYAHYDFSINLSG